MTESVALSSRNLFVSALEKNSLVPLVKLHLGNDGSSCSIIESNNTLVEESMVVRA